jgi:hypothetical protein
LFLEIRKSLALARQGAAIHDRAACSLVSRSVPAELSLHAVRGAYCVTIS